MQRIGWVLLGPSALLGIVLMLDDFNLEWLCTAVSRRLPDFPIMETLNNIALIGTLVSLLFIVCSRERVEDEMIGRMRLNALLAALYVNTAFIIAAALTTYGLKFLNIMVYNLFTMPVIFLVIYRWQLWRARKEAVDEE